MPTEREVWEYYSQHLPAEIEVVGKPLYLVKPRDPLEEISALGAAAEEPTFIYRNPRFFPRPVNPGLFVVVKPRREDPLDPDVVAAHVEMATLSAEQVAMNCWPQPEAGTI